MGRDYLKITDKGNIVLEQMFSALAESGKDSIAEELQYAIKLLAGFALDSIDMAEKLEDPISKMRFLHKKCDESGMLWEHAFTRLLGPMPKATCKPQCNSCCSIRTDVCGFEADFLRSIAKPHHVEQARRGASDKDMENLDSFMKLGFKSRICPFNSKSGLCTVYEDRPISCRKHRVASPVNLCQDFKNDPLVKNIINVGYEIFFAYVGDKYGVSGLRYEVSKKQI